MKINFWKKMEIFSFLREKKFPLKNWKNVSGFLNSFQINDSKKIWAFPKNKFEWKQKHDFEKILFSQPLIVRYRDRVQQMTILDPRPQSRITLHRVSWKIRLSSLHLPSAGEFRNFMPAQLSSIGWVAKKSYFFLSLSRTLWFFWRKLY